MLHLSDRGDAIAERGDSVARTDENVPPNDLERSVGEVATSSEVVQHLANASISSCDAVVARDGPCDVRSQELMQRNVRAPRVELVLGRMQSVKNGYGGVPVHNRHPMASLFRGAAIQFAIIQRLASRVPYRAQASWCGIQTAQA